MEYWGAIIASLALFISVWQIIFNIKVRKQEIKNNIWRDIQEKYYRCEESWANLKSSSIELMNKREELWGELEFKLLIMKKSGEKEKFGFHQQVIENYYKRKIKSTENSNFNIKAQAVRGIEQYIDELLVVIKNLRKKDRVELVKEEKLIDSFAEDQTWISDVWEHLSIAEYIMLSLNQVKNELNGIINNKPLKPSRTRFTHYKQYKENMENALKELNIQMQKDKNKTRN